MMYLPRLCEHCLNPACVAACPSGSIYKREEDGIVLIDQDKCRGWRMCVSGCPYKKIYYNWKSRQGREVHLLLSAHRGRPADRVLARPASAASATSACCSTTPTASRRRPASRTSKDLYQAQLDIFLDPERPDGDRAGARRRHSRRLAGSARKQSPVYKMAMDWKVALAAASRIPHAADGLVRAAAVADPVGRRRRPDRHRRRDARRAAAAHPGQYLANLLTAGDDGAGGARAERMLAMRAYMRAKHVDGAIDDGRRWSRSASARPQVEDMYQSWRSPTTRTAS